MHSPTRSRAPLLPGTSSARSSMERSGSSRGVGGYVNGNTSGEGGSSSKPPSGQTGYIESYNNNGEGSSSTSRLSNGSIVVQSPIAESSNSHHFHQPHQHSNLQYQYPTSGGGRSEDIQQNQSKHLPRITTTSAADGSQGPRSAPVSGPFNTSMSPLNLNGTPIRSASSPEPQSHSTEPGPPVLGNPYYPPSSLKFPTPQIPGSSPGPTGQTGLPPRKSSHQNNFGSLPASSPLAGSSRELGSQSSHQSFGGDSDGHTQNTDHQQEKEKRTGRSREPTYCGQCGQVVHGQFVRAMGKVYHLNCFRCKDCNKVVAQKFFPVEDGEGMYPLCERDYFARLDLICAKCDQALRSSYITACGDKYHVEHFTCSECDVVFGPNDSYYEHSGKVYCHFHYSTRFAVKCVGCETAILKQFVEMNRNGRDECWHPECYMISKFWNVRLASKNFNTPANSAVSSSVSLLEMTSSIPQPGSSHGSTQTASDAMTPEDLKEKQESMDIKVTQIWNVLSGYEESSAALIGEMLRAVNGRNLLEIVLLAERFILHVEALFAVIDDLEAQFALAGMKGMSHAREAKQLCRKLVNLFSTMSQISPNGTTQPNNQDLYTLITQLAHYLKILIRIALTGSIKLEREQGHSGAMMNTLARLNLLSMDGSDPCVKKRGDHPDVASKDESKSRSGTTTPASGQGIEEESLRKAIDALPRKPVGYIPSTKEIAYGYRSLAPETTRETTLRGPQDEDFVPPEGCTSCHQAIEEDCIRVGMFNRWHSPCVECVSCGDRAVPLQSEEQDDGPQKYKEDGTPIITVKTKRPPPRVAEFSFEPPLPPSAIYCSQHRSPQATDGFESVSRLEQYAFLLHIALRRLYVHFRIHYNLPSVRDRGLEDVATPARDSDMKRMKSIVTLDRKLSSTARLPQRSTVVESPAGRIANPDGKIISARSKEVSPTREGDTSATDDAPSSATLDVIRPPFARNNTSVLIVNDNGPELPDEVVEQLAAHHMMQEDDAITLGDIPNLADATMRQRESEGQKPTLASLNQLQSLILKHFALLQLQKSGLGHLIEMDDILELLEVRKSQWWNKIFKGNAKEKQKRKGVFGVPLEILVEKTGSDSQQGASNEQLRVPEFIEEMIATMRQMDMAIEGIFRKNGNIRRLQQISEALDKDSTAVNLSEENPVQLAALLKRFLRELPDPLLTFKLHKLFCAAASFQQVEERQRCLHLLVCLLPRYNRDTMEVLFVFLKWVASFSYKDEETGSRMDLGNLATVICPSILYAKGTNAAKDESFIAITAVQDLLENQEEYYTVPNDLLFVINEQIYHIFAKELDLPPKEIHRHCSKYMQARGAPSSRVASSNSGPIRAMPSDGRLSVHRSDGNLSNGIDGPLSDIRNGSTAPVNIPNHSPFRQQVSGTTQTSSSHAAGGSRPTSWLQQSQPGSQQSLNLAAVGSPSSHGPWRGPFQGVQAGGNGSRNSSRGSAPSSPGPDERAGRGSFQYERDGSFLGQGQQNQALGRRTPL